METEDGWPDWCHLCTCTQKLIKSDIKVGIVVGGSQCGSWHGNGRWLAKLGAFCPHPARAERDGGWCRHNTYLSGLAGTKEMMRFLKKVYDLAASKPDILLWNIMNSSKN